MLGILQKKTFFQWQKSVGNAKNPSLHGNFRRIFAGHESVGKMVVGNINRQIFWYFSVRRKFFDRNSVGKNSWEIFDELFPFKISD